MPSLKPNPTQEGPVGHLDHKQPLLETVWELEWADSPSERDSRVDGDGIISQPAVDPKESRSLSWPGMGLLTFSVPRSLSVDPTSRTT